MVENGDGEEDAGGEENGDGTGMWRRGWWWYRDGEGEETITYQRCRIM